MTAYPRTVSASEISPEVKALINELTTRLLSGNSSTHALLREQFARASIRDVELTGVGSSPISRFQETLLPLHLLA